LIAICNSLGDTINNISLSKMGFSTMAITGAFAGPTFYVLVGEGGSLLITTILNG